MSLWNKSLWKAAFAMTQIFENSVKAKAFSLLETKNSNHVCKGTIRSARFKSGNQRFLYEITRLVKKVAY